MNSNLFSAVIGHSCTVVHLPPGNEWLESYGIGAGSRLILLSRSGCGVTVRMREIKYAIGRRLAEIITVSIPDDRAGDI